MTIRLSRTNGGKAWGSNSAERTHCLNDIKSPDRVISENIGVPGGDRRRINAETGPNRWPITRSVQRAYAIAALRPAIAGVR
jgi:hypothetical protein